ncbi:hypothetical protein Tco_0123777 [Tanacetum coccineum]
MGEDYTWIDEKEIATNEAPNDYREGFDKFGKGPSWDNNIGRKKDKDRLYSYNGPNRGLLANLSKSPREIIATEKATKGFKQPPRMVRRRRSCDITKYCHFYEDHGHDTNQCREPRHQIKEAVRSGQLAHLVKGIKKGKANNSDTQLGEWKKRDKDIVPAEAPIHMISRESPISKRKSLEEPIDGIRNHVSPPCEHSWPLGEVPLEVTIGENPYTKTKTLNFIIVRSDSPHNLLLGRTAIQRMGIVVSTIHATIKFNTPTKLARYPHPTNLTKLKKDRRRLRKPSRKLRGMYSVV